MAGNRNKLSQPQLANLFAVITAGIGLMVVLSRKFSLPTVETMLPGYPSMRFNTALCLFLLGCGYFFAFGKKRRLAYGVLLSAFAIGFTSFIEYVARVSVGLDQIFFLDPNGSRPNAPGLMSPITATVITLTAAAMLLRLRGFRAKRWQAPVLCNLFLVGIAFLGYAYSAQSLARFYPYSTVSLLADTAMLLINLALLFSAPCQGFMAVFNSPWAGGEMSRKLLPLSLLVLAALGFMVRQGEGLGFYDSSLDAVFVVALGAAIIMWLIWGRAKALNQFDEELIQKQRELSVAFEKEKATSNNLQLLLQHAPGAVAMLDTQMRYLWVSERWRQDYGLVGRELIGRSHYDTFPEIPERWRQIHLRCLAGAVEKMEEDTFPRKDGETVWLRWEIRPWLTVKGAIGGIVIFTEDITARKLAEDKLRRLNQELEQRVWERTLELELQGTVVRNMAEGVCLVNAGDGTIAYANPKFEAMFGYDTGELVGVHVQELNAGEPGVNPAEVAADLMGKIRRFGTFSYEVHNRKKDGSEFWCRATASVLNHPQFGEVLVAVQEDITERKRAADALRMSERRFRDLISLASDGIFETGKDGTYVEVNPAGCVLLGRPKEEILGKTALDFVADEDRARVIASLAEARAKGGAQLISEFGVKRRDGTILPAEVSAMVLPDGRRISFLRDLTSRKQAAAALATSERRYRSLVEGAYDSILVADETGKIVFINEQLGSKFGYTAEELTGKNVETLLPERFRADHVLNRQAFALNAQARTMGAGLDLYARKKNGSEFPVDISLSPMVTPEGMRITAIIRDITERKRYEEQQTLLSELGKAISEVRGYEERAQKAADCIVPKMADVCALRLWENGELKLKGVAARDWPGRDRYLSIVRSEQRLATALGAAATVASGQPLLVADVGEPEPDDATLAEIRRSAQEFGFISYAVAPMKAQGQIIGTLALGMTGSGRKFSARDVKFLEIVANRCAVSIENARLYRQAQVARLVTDNMPALIAYWDTNERCRFANRAYADWFGIDPEQLIGRTLENLVGKTIYEKNKPYIEDALAGKAQFFERDLIKHSTGELRHTQARYLPELIDGKVAGFFVLVTDITDLKRAQVAALSEKARAEAAVQLREEVLGIVSHDLRNPLASIDMSAQLLSNIEPSKEKVDQYAERIRGATKTMLRMIADLLDFGKIQGGAFTVEKMPVTLQTVIEDAMDAMYARARERDVQLEVDFPAREVSLLADERRVVQVLWNLVGNAIKFSPPGGKVEVKAELGDGAVKFSVVDSGPGILAEDLPKVFERFWQSKKTATKGTGLGLAIAKGIVDAHGGKIWAESTAGQGAKFYFTLPLNGAAIGEGRRIFPAAPRTPAPLPLKGLHILAVDRSPANLRLIRFLLEHSGARVTGAASVAEAMAKLLRERPDALIADVDLKAEGLELVEQIRRLAGRGESRVPAAAIADSLGEAERRKLEEAGFGDIFSGPVTADKLVHSVKKILGGDLHS